MKKLLLLFLLAGLFSSCMTNNPSNDKAAKSKAGVQAFYDQVINAHNPAMVDSFCAPDFTDHNPDQGHSGKGVDDLKAAFKDFFTGFPDIHMTVDMMVANGDTVASMITMTGTNSGMMMGAPPTNKQVSIQGMDFIVLKDGKATDRWGFFDVMKMMQQMGMMPEPGAQAHADTVKMMNAEKK